MSSSLDNQSIYEVFRACRLCGAGGGYKMPIIPSVAGFDCTVPSDVELRQKIRECVQIEVSEGDKMPPLICELCMDKVNDFYEFLEMCQQTNNKTRMRLGLPPIRPRGPSDAGDCILGVTEPVLANDGNDSSVLTPRLKTIKKEKNLNEQNDKNVKEKNDKIAKEKQDARERRDANRIKFLMKEIEDLKKLKALGSSRSSRKSYREPRSPQRESRSSSSSSRTTRSRAPTPPPARESRATFKLSDHMKLSRMQQQDQNENKKSKRATTKSILKKEKDIKNESSDDENSDDSSLLTQSRKRRHDKQPAKEEVPHKIPKLTIKLPPAPSPKFTKPGPKSAKPGPISSKHGPVSSKPGPVSSKPGPLSSKPGPVSSKPGPVTSKSGSVTSKPGPVSSKPGPVSSKPGPVSSKPGPVSSKPGPVSSKPGHVLSKPGPVSSKPGPMSSKPGPKSTKRSASPPPENVCEICSCKCKTLGGLSSHIRRTHLVSYTEAELACNACGVWFSNDDETAAHHRMHSAKSLPYHCRHCADDFKNEISFQEHVDKKRCALSIEVPDVKCPKCWKFFPTRNLMKEHCCAGESARPGKCRKCSRSYASQKSLKKHQSVCRVKNKAPAKEVRAKEPKLQVRMSRCDALLKKRILNHYDVSSVTTPFGRDRNCVYPYLYKSVRIKPEPLEHDGMVRIRQDVKDEIYTEEDYKHWDSDMSSDSDDDTTDQDQEKPVTTIKTKKVASLTKLSLKTLFSKRCLGKVPRKLRKMKSDNFDLMPNNDFENNFSDDISNIINNLNDDVINDEAKDSNDKPKDTISCDSGSLLDQDRSILFNDVYDTNSKASDDNVNVSTEIQSTNVEPIDSTESQITMGTESNNKDEQNLSEDKEKYCLIVPNGVLQNTDATDQDNVSKDVDFKDIIDNCVTESGKVNGELADIAKDIETTESGKVNGEIADVAKDIETMRESNVEPTEISNKSGVSEKELEDERLMDEIDAHINDDTEKEIEKRSLSERDDKITLEDLVSKNFENKSLGLESISDEEFNFDT